jgi:hypothetical protein
VLGNDAFDDGLEGELLVGVEAADGLELKAEVVVGAALVVVEEQEVGGGT